MRASNSLTKQLRYYYRHRKERLAYQRGYYLKHQTTIRTKRMERYHNNKVKRTRINNSLIREIYNKAYTTLRNFQIQNKELFREAYYHTHGRPKGKRTYSTWQKGRLQFHMIPELSFRIGYRYGLIPYVSEVLVDWKHKAKNVIDARTLTIQTAHFLGFKMGDSIIWKEQNPYSGKIETHWLCFDKSGLDMSHLNDSAKLVEMRVESGLKGVELLIMFANKYSVEGYLQHYRGNKLLSTSELKNALKDYLKHYPLAQTV